MSGPVASTPLAWRVIGRSPATPTGSPAGTYYGGLVLSTYGGLVLSTAMLPGRGCGIGEALAGILRPGNAKPNTAATTSRWQRR